MRTSTAVPCPTSAATSSNCPSAGRCTDGTNSGTASGKASARKRQGIGSISKAAPTSPESWAQPGATGTVQTAPGQLPSHARPAHSRCTTQAPSHHSGVATMPFGAITIERPVS